MTNSQTQQLHQQADLLLNSNHLVEAHTVYGQICRLDSNDAEAFMMRGALEGEMGKVEAALQSLNEAIRIDPDYADSYHTLAHLLQHTGKLTEARDALKKAVEIDTEFTEAWAMLSGLLGQLGDFAEAEIVSRRSLELDPTLIDARTNLANSLIEQGKNEEVVVELKQVVEQQPSNAHTWSQLGVILTRLERFNEAIPALETALRLNPSDNEAQVALSYAYTDQKNYIKAAELLRKLIKNNPDDGQLWATLVHITNEQNNKDEWQSLVDYCEQIEEYYPNNRHISLSYGYALEKLENVESAREKYQQITLEFPDWGDGWNRLGLLYTNQEQNQQALSCLKKAIDCGVDSPLTLCMYGAVLRISGSFTEAECYCRRAMEKAPDIVPVYIHLGLVQTVMGELERAIETFHKGLDHEPDNLTLIAGLSDILERQGEFDKALELLEPYLDSDKESIDQIIYMYAKVSNRLKRGEQALKLVEEALARDNIMRHSKMNLHFSAGDTCQSLQQYDIAIEHYHKANALSELDFDHNAHIRFIENTIAAFNKDTLAHLADLGNPSARPIFIVGMPRSGTSLVEQILASHPHVFGAGELMDFAAVAQGLGFDNGEASGYIARLASLTSEETNRYAEAYLQSIDKPSNGESYVTDKLPYNFLRLGLIQILFPNARIIHTRRDPMDSCLSCYFLDFIGVHPHAYGLEDLGVYYREYERLMAHWHDVLSIPILDVQYEDAVNDIEGTCRRIIEFCELDWDDRVLNFHQTERVVRTSSYDQVRRPVYTSSVGRWKPYEQWLDPLKKGLSSQ